MKKKKESLCLINIWNSLCNIPKSTMHLGLKKMKCLQKIRFRKIAKPQNDIKKKLEIQSLLEIRKLLDFTKRTAIQFTNTTQQNSGKNIKNTLKNTI